MNETMNDEYLSHHGIKGQRWGIRRYQNPDGSLTPAGEKRYAKLEKKLNSIGPETRQERQRSEIEARAKRDAMSNEELRKSIERLRLEQEYDRVITSNPGAKSRTEGQKWANDTLQKVGTSSLTAVSSELGKATGKVVIAAALSAIAPAYMAKFGVNLFDIVFSKKK